MNIFIFESLPEIHTETILLNEDILGMCNSINNNIELTTALNVRVRTEDVIVITNYLQESNQDYSKEEIIVLAQKMIIEDIQNNYPEIPDSWIIEDVIYNG